MILDPSILHGPPKVNYVIEGKFKTFPLYIKKENLYDHKQRLHIQPGIEINLTISGKGAYVIGDQIYMQSPGQLILFHGNTPHQIYVDPSTEYSRIVLCIANEELNKGPWSSLFPTMDLHWLSNLGCQQIKLKPEYFSQIQWIVSLMSSEFQKKDRGWQTVTYSQFTSLSVIIRRIIDKENNERSVHSPNPVSSVPICCSYIKNNLNQDLSLNKIAQMFYVSPEHLTRQFKKELGISFYQYVLRERVNLSKEMLANQPEISLTEVAFAAGFSTPSHFSRVFKTFANMAPSEYKKQRLVDGTKK